MPQPFAFWCGAAARLWQKKRPLPAAGFVEGERARIARDLHDDLGAALSELVMLADQAPLHRASPERLEQTLAAIGQRARASLEALDVIVWSINPVHDTLESFANFSAAFARQYLGHAAIALRLRIGAPFPSPLLDAAARRHLFCVIKEALYNAVRHSNATEIVLSMECIGNQLEISLADNGCGFDLDAARCGNGLRNMHSRMEELGGTCIVHSPTSGGTQIVLALPLLSLFAA